MTSDLSVRVAEVVREGFLGYADRFAEITARASDHFVAGDFRALSVEARARIDLHTDVVEETVARIRTELAHFDDGREVWVSARDRFAVDTSGRPDGELAETFFNSVSRRALGTVGVDGALQFVTDLGQHGGVPPLTRHEGRGFGEMLRQVVAEVALVGRWEDLTRDLRRTEEAVLGRLEERGVIRVPIAVELLRPVFYRGRGAYLVGAFEVGDERHPLVLAVRHGARGHTIRAVLTQPDDVLVLFSYTQSPFHVSLEAPAPVVGYLGPLAPGKPRAELYAALGFHHHAKTELYRDLVARLSAADERFEHAPGVPGLVMIVFTMPSHDFVFKVIRDRFPAQKRTTRRRVMENYRLVFRHDRAGRLVEAYEFERLVLARGRFDPELLEELLTEATRSVTLEGPSVAFGHVYVERRVTPLDVFLREADSASAESALVDYGRAIKNLAASNIFPGDMLIKNFGVTRTGRVVFYDYDELTELIDCRFRRLPESDDPAMEMTAEPWFGVGPNDVFPEELSRFLGVSGRRRSSFERLHADLYDVEFWRAVQDRVRSGELIEIYPYRRSRRIDERSAGVR